jgi:hypothetical protein
MAARLALAGKATAIPKQTDGIVESIRLLRVTRDGAVKARSAAMVGLSQLIVTAPQQLREQLAVRRSIRGKAALCRKLRLRDPGLLLRARPSDSSVSKAPPGDIVWCSILEERWKRSSSESVRLMSTRRK